nr:transposase (putative), gypsy type [Tanacetum cinerariifolium]
MSTIRDIKSKLTQKVLDALCTKYHIPACVHPTLPGPNQSILQSPDGQIGVYTQFFDFANYRIPLSQFFVDILGHFHIHLSQLSVFGAAKVSHFEILCRVHCFQPTVNCFKMDLFSFIRHSDPTKMLVGERELADREVKLLTLTEGRVVPSVPPASAASGGSGDSIDKLFDEGDDAGQDHSIERVDDAPEKAIAKDVSEEVVEKTKKLKRKRKAAGDASGFTLPPKKLREEYHVLGGRCLDYK